MSQLLVADWNLSNPEGEKKIYKGEERREKTKEGRQIEGHHFCAVSGS